MDEGEELTLPASAFDHIIERPRLISALEEAAARVILFCAPAGFGKTTLARQWSDRQRRTPVWHRTTRASGDVAALAVSLDNLFAGVGAPKDRDPNRIAMIAAANPRPEPLARALVSTYKRLPKSLLLVIDEYEAADTAEADQLFGALVDGLPIRFLVTSRSRPTWFEPRLTVYGEAVELGVDDLTMTDEEAEAVLELGRRGKADRAVVEQAQGWPAVLGLAAMRSEKDLPERLLPRALYNFLASELLESVSDKLHEALLLVAAAGVSSTEVARLLIGPNWRSVLRSAQDQHLLTIGFDEEIALHPLLRELLLMELKDPDRREARSFQLRPLIEHQRWDEALAAAEALPVSSFVSDALTHALEHLLHNGRTETLRRWANVGRVSGIAREIVDYIDAELALRDAAFDKALVFGDRSAARLTGRFAARAHLCAARAAHFSERRERAAEHAIAAQALATDHRTLLDAVWARFTQAADLESPETLTVLKEFISLGDNSDETQLRLVQGKLILAQLSGDFDSVLDEAQVASALTGRGADPHAESAFLSMYAETLATRARYAEAFDIANRAIELARRFEIDFVERYTLFQRIKALIGLRRFTKAEQALNEIGRYLKKSPDAYMFAHSANLRASLYLSLGDYERAKSALSVTPSERVSVGQRAERLGLIALSLAAQGKSEDARRTAEAAEERSTAREVAAFASLARCLSAFSMGEESLARTELRQALDVGAYHQAILAFRTSIDIAVLSASIPEYRELLTRILLAANEKTIARKIGIEVPRSAQRTEALSPRELEIHELIAQGLTNLEIARLLFISPSTAKVHVHHVLEKLGVRSRVEAARLWDASGIDQS